ncbi:unnamed protein product (macronuclear) [Paramecium tetraurelia]|uniref:Uncharacterized protein n=1 Tax=Paramecium tetraurelia TaxID=5888 RepID=A0CQJ5_PARTE|nr:uncharacterized protein GSPATT00009410001 [Paramecium tetraurelia]CAK73062.1 unnamed protein product [Paramecium tetraurelia]|eukprot:XP_001440459.1 hypothetical protein (macronuclear) [Paramecium tetraurelia strain d4-2]
MQTLRKYLKIGLRKRSQIPIASFEDKEEQYYQNMDEQKQCEESLYCEFKRMSISEQTDEHLKNAKKKKQQQEGENFMFLYQSNQQIVEENINYRSTKHSVELQEIEIIDNSSNVLQDQTIEQFNIIKVDEIDYVNQLSFLKQQTRLNQETKSQFKSFKKNKFDCFSIKHKKISK